MAVGDIAHLLTPNLEAEARLWKNRESALETVICLTRDKSDEEKLLVLGAIKTKLSTPPDDRGGLAHGEGALMAQIESAKRDQEHQRAALFQILLAGVVLEKRSWVSRAAACSHLASLASRRELLPAGAPSTGEYLNDVLAILESHPRDRLAEAYLERIDGVVAQLEERKSGWSSLPSDREIDAASSPKPARKSGSGCAVVLALGFSAMTAARLMELVATR
tara:strand:+ start:138 stop:800 length:663 start_codon:yes stop_codon:yes gene_type:complete